jgi:hypothetical protein
VPHKDVEPLLDESVVVLPLISGRYAPAYKRHGQDVSVLHFIGAEKPWRRGTYEGGATTLLATS